MKPPRTGKWAGANAIGNMEQVIALSIVIAIVAFAAV